MPLINPGSSSYSIYDPTLPNRIVSGVQQAPTQAPTTIASAASGGQGPQYNPSFGADTSPTPTPTVPAPATALTYPSSFAATGGYNPSPLGSALASSVKGNYLNRSLGNLDARGAPYPATRPQATPLNQTPLPPARPAGLGQPNDVQTAQAPAPATPQGWNLFAAIGQALGHLLGYNAQGQPQGMSGLIRNPVQTVPTTALRMPTPQQAASRYQGRTLFG